MTTEPVSTVGLGMSRTLVKKLLDKNAEAITAIRKHIEDLHKSEFNLILMQSELQLIDGALAKRSNGGNNDAVDAIESITRLRTKIASLTQTDIDAIIAADKLLADIEHREPHTEAYLAERYAKLTACPTKQAMMDSKSEA